MAILAPEALRGLLAVPVALLFKLTCLEYFVSKKEEEEYEQRGYTRMPEETDDTAPDAPDAEEIADASERRLDARMGFLLAKGLGKEKRDKITYDTNEKSQRNRIKFALLVLAILILATFFFFKTFSRGGGR